MNNTFPLHLSVHTKYKILGDFVVCISLCLCNCNPFRVKESFGKYVRVSMDLIMGKNFVYCDYTHKRTCTRNEQKCRAQEQDTGTQHKIYKWDF